MIIKKAIWNSLKNNILEGTWYANEIYFIGTYSCMLYFYIFTSSLSSLKIYYIHHANVCHWSDKFGSMSSQKCDLWIK